MTAIAASGTELFIGGGFYSVNGYWAPNFAELIITSVAAVHEPPGVNCSAGGLKIETNDGNGIITLAYVRDGANGASANVVVTDESAGRLG